MIGQLYRHVKSGGVYIVTGFCVIEATNRPGILYRKVNAGYDVTWVRDRAEFLDGRFVVHDVAPLAPPKRNRTGLKCLLGFHNMEARSDQTGCWGECAHCGVKMGFVSQSLLQKDLPPRTHPKLNDGA